MNVPLEQLEPRDLWSHFARLNGVPRPSKREDRAVQFMREFGESLGLETLVDELGNVIIRKPATPGMEDRAGVVLQGHLDMVHQKNADTEFDFETQGIEMYLDDDWVKARGTTLGADNGIGVASAMAILASDDIPHPPLEALFTIDEETGMTGAKGLAPGLLEGRFLLNLDSEDDEEITIGCAGGVDVTVKGSLPTEPAQGAAFRITVRGLTGGHSGMDIHRGRANANKLLGRLLLSLEEQLDIRIAEVDAGGLRNAIPREATAVFLMEGQLTELESHLAALAKEVRAEYGVTDPGLEIELQPGEAPSEAMTVEAQQALLRAIAACPNGVYRMSPDVEDLVQTSNNLARVRASQGRFEVLCLTRGSLDSEKMQHAREIRALFRLIGAEVTLSGEYPGWKPEPDSDIVRLVSRVYRERFGREAPILACHAGLECGILGKAYPEIQMISFGPNIRGAHSPDEKVQVSSVQKFWGFLQDVLTQVPAAA
jgi:dipeptidase D